ncbi:MAG: PKD repeat protein [Cyclobacteriaceae bacterium]|jgi:PKD repeat protein
MKKIYLLFATALVVGVFGLLVKSADQDVKSKYAHTEKTQKKAGYDRPDLALLREFNMTKDPALGYPPVQRLNKGFSYAKSLIANKRTASEAKWTERGPNNFGGRTRAVMFDPNDPTNKKVWAAGVTGGLWYNEDITSPTTEWIKVNDFLGTLAVNNIAFDPNNTDVFYAGSGEGWFGGGMIRGNGIWKSIDAGKTWNNLIATNGNEFAYVQKVVITGQSTILAATRGFQGGPGGLYRSTDSGDSWTRIFGGPAADIEVVGNIIYASKGIFSVGALFKSVDDGITFEEITPAEGAERIEIGVHPNHASTVYAIATTGSDVGWFYRSDNAGVSWTKLAVPFYLNSTSCVASTSDFTRQQAWYDLIIGVHPIDAKTVVVGGIDLHRSTDAGATWEPISYWTGACDALVHADQHNFIFRPGFPNQVLATNDGGVYYSKDITKADASGPIFESRNNGYNVTQFYACAAKNEAGVSYFLAGAQDNGSHQFQTNGVNSTLEVTGGDGAYCFIDQNESNIQITSYVYNNYYLTRDDWSTNSRFGVGDDSGAFINPSEYSSATNTLFTAGNSGNFHRYVIPETESPTSEEFDLGIAGDISALTVSEFDSDLLYVGTGGKVYKIENVNSATPTATDISGSSLPTAYMSSIAIGNSDNQIFVTYANYGVTSVWETENGGATWTSKEGNLPDMPVRWALYNPDNTNEILIATDLGIWSSVDLASSNPSWSPANEGLANVRCDMIKYRSSDGLVSVATHGRGLYTSDVFAKISIVDFYSSNLVAYPSKSISFIDASTKATSYAWDFGDGNTSTDENPEHVYAASGVYTVTLKINGDDALLKTLEVNVLPKLSTDYLIANGGDFETNQSDFVAVTVSGTGFELGSSLIPGKKGTNSGSNAWVLGVSDLIYERYSEAYLYSPSFDFSLSGTYSLEFYTQYAIEDEWDGFLLESSIDGGKSWLKVGDYLDATNWYNQIAIDQNGIFPPGKSFFSGDTGNEFVKKSVDITALGGNADAAFRFVFKSDPAAEEEGLAIDDFQITGPTATAVAVSFDIQGTPCSGEIVNIVNTSTGAITGYSWNFGENAIPPTATGFGPFEITYTAGGVKAIALTASTSGDAVVINNSLEVGVFPANISVIGSGSEICAGESLDIVIPNAENGITYGVFSSKNDTQVGADAVGSGADLTFTTDVLTTGQYVYYVKAASSSCQRELSQTVGVKVKAQPQVSIEESGKFYKSTYKSANAYQWFLNGDTIVAATFADYTPTVGGDYTVAVELNGCVAFSEAISRNVLGFDTSTTDVQIYPNPASDFIKLSTKDDSIITYIRVFDLSGKLQIERNGFNKADGSMNISGLKSGIYNITIFTENGQISTYKFLKK